MISADEMKNRSRGISTDMSGEAVARRIAIVSQLRELTRQLGSIQLDARVDAEQPQRKSPET